MQISTERLTLREFVPDDWSAVLTYQRDSRYLRYYPWNERTEADVRAFIQMFLDQQAESPRRKFQLAITLSTTGVLIGNCGLRRKLENDWEADIGYELAPAHWGNGYATEAARAMMDYGFTELGLHRVSSWCIADNTPSVSVLERLGLHLEGRQRETDYYKGRWWDTLQYGILKSEWER